MKQQSDPSFKFAIGADEEPEMGVGPGAKPGGVIAGKKIEAALFSAAHECLCAETVSTRLCGPGMSGSARSLLV